MRWRSSDLSFIAAVVVSIGTAGCGAADDASPTASGFPADPYAVLTSAQGKLTIEVRTAPSQPPGRGRSDVQFVVRDSGGAVVDGLNVDAVPWMPVMDHGTSVKPVPSSEGNGVYALHNVVLIMPGLWELQTTFSGVVMDTATPVFDVP